jgi:hypothetical protein
MHVAKEARSKWRNFAVRKKPLDIHPNQSATEHCTCFHASGRSSGLGSLLTHRWREKDSNPRSPVAEAILEETASARLRFGSSPASRTHKGAAPEISAGVSTERKTVR